MTKTERAGTNQVKEKQCTMISKCGSPDTMGSFVRYVVRNLVRSSSHIASQSFTEGLLFRACLVASAGHHSGSVCCPTRLKPLRYRPESFKGIEGHRRHVARAPALQVCPRGSRNTFLERTGTLSAYLPEIEVDTRVPPTKQSSYARQRQK